MSKQRARMFTHQTATTIPSLPRRERRRRTSNLSMESPHMRRIAPDMRTTGWARSSLGTREATRLSPSAKCLMVRTMTCRPRPSQGYRRGKKEDPTLQVECGTSRVRIYGPGGQSPPRPTEETGRRSKPPTLQEMSLRWVAGSLEAAQECASV